MSFSKAMIQVKRSEGGYVCDPDDPGGETYCGVSRRFFPRWNGWKEIDRLKKAIGPIKTNTIFGSNMSLSADVQNFYLKYFWKKLRCDQIKNPILAEHLFDCGINLGKKSAVKLFQNCLCTYVKGEAVIVDGLIGKQTIGALDRMPSEFVNYLVQYRIGVYFQKCYKKPVKFKYLRGWCLRSLKYLDK